MADKYANLRVQLIPAAVAGALGVGLLVALNGLRDGAEFPTTLFALAGAIGMAALICWNANLLAQKKALQQAYEELEQGVRDRTAELTRLNDNLCREVEERRLAETRLREQQEHLHAVADNLPEGAIYQVVKPVGGRRFFRYCSGGVERLFGVPAAEAMADAGNLYGLYLAEDLPRLRAAAEESQRSQSVYDCEFRIHTRSGQLKWVRCRSRPRRLPDGATLWDGIVTDITDFKETEARLLQSLGEKETLLKEVHHRVKNNLAITVSLLNFQVRRATDAQVLETLREAQNRVRSMAMVHELLYRSASLASIDLPSYVEQVTRQVLESYHAADRIWPDLSVSAAALPLEAAVPFGLVLNELVSNVCKHAYPDGAAGRLSVRVNCDEAGRVHLVVADRGVGFPRDVDPFAPPSLGLRLIRDLTNQLGGRVEFVRAPGTTCHITLESHWGSKP